MSSSNFLDACQSSYEEGLMLAPEDLPLASSEERVVHSYDRFFKAVSQATTRRDTEGPTQLPTLDNVLLELPGLPESRQKELETVWSCAQRFVQIQKLVEKFQGYRSDLVRRLKERTRPLYGSLSSFEREDGLKELRWGQSRLEEQLHFTNALLVGMEQRYDPIPSLLAELCHKIDSQRETNEHTPLQQMVYDNRRQIDRMEQRLVDIDAKLSKQGTEMGFVSASWPETLHNNIVYSSSDGGSSEGQREAMSTAPEELPHRDNNSEKGTPQQSTLPVQKTEKAPALVAASNFETGKPSSLHSETTAVASTMIEPVTTVPSSMASCNKTELDVAREMSHKERVEKSKTQTQGAADEKLLTSEFDAVFLEDALVVQENILTSSLGQCSSRVPKRRSRRAIPRTGSARKCDQPIQCNKGLQLDVEDPLSDPHLY